MKEIIIRNLIEKDSDKRVNIKCDGLDFQPWFKEKMGNSIIRLSRKVAIKDEESRDVLFVLKDMISMHLRIIGFGATASDNIRETTIKYILIDGIEGLKQANDEFHLELRLSKSDKIKNEETQKHDEQIRNEIRKILLITDIQGELSFMFSKVRAIKDKDNKDEKFQNLLDKTINGTYKLDKFLKEYQNEY